MLLLRRALGFIMQRLLNNYASYENERIKKVLGGAIIQYPFQISGLQNILAGQSVNIGQHSVIMTTRAKLIIKGQFVSGPGLTIITGDHMPFVGKFLDTVTDLDKDCFDTNCSYDKDVIIDKDVWCGANVTILKGVTIGRGCIIAAGAVVTHDIPPYCIAGGVPAKPLKPRWTVEQIIEHETKVYSENERISIDEINTFFNEYRMRDR